MDELAKKKVQAAKIVLDKLGANWTKTVYWLDNEYQPQKIDDPAEEGKFFAETNYVIDIKSDTHRY